MKSTAKQQLSNDRRAWRDVLIAIDSHLFVIPTWFPSEAKEVAAPKAYAAELRRIRTEVLRRRRADKSRKG